MPKYHKEPHYFATDLYEFQRFVPHVRWFTDLDSYRSLFAPTADALRSGEASVYYLFSKSAA